ncbi:MAG TPA: ABC transporter permease [Chloroflexota bacterium]|nr:ABC transporter permease [Chloroflexota bacterium]
MASVQSSAPPVSAAGVDDGQGLLDARLSAAPAWQVWYLRNERVVLGILGLVSVIGLWELLVRVGLVRALFVSSPSGILQATIIAIRDGSLGQSVAASLIEYFLGFAAAAVVGILVGLGAGWYRRLDCVVSPWITVLYAMPHVALIPLAILWFGIGLSYKVFFVFLISIFPIVINTLAGVKATEAHYLDVAKSFRAGQLRIFRTVVLPGAVPFIMTGLRLGAGRAWIGVVVAELVGANSGLGFIIGQASEMLDTAKMMMAIVALGILGMVLIELMHLVEKRFDVWRPQQQPTT